MSDNPLESSPERDAEIEARAKALWEADGSPEGRLADYHEQADELVRMSGSGTPGQLPNPMTLDEPMPGVLVEEAAIQENLGEFPGAAGNADQGETRETPMTRGELRHGEEQPDGDAAS